MSEREPMHQEPVPEEQDELYEKYEEGKLGPNRKRHN